MTDHRSPESQLPAVFAVLWPSTGPSRLPVRSLIHANQSPRIRE